MIEEIGWDVYQEARRRRRQDIEQEITEIQTKIEYGEMTDAEWQASTDRLAELSQMLDIKDADESDKRYRERVRA